jgi:hypothetical protein
MVNPATKQHTSATHVNRHMFILLQRISRTQTKIMDLTCFAFSVSSVPLYVYKVMLRIPVEDNEETLVRYPQAFMLHRT